MFCNAGLWSVREIQHGAVDGREKQRRSGSLVTVGAASGRDKRTLLARLFLPFFFLCDGMDTALPLLGLSSEVTAFSAIRRSHVDTNNTKSDRNKTHFNTFKAKRNLPRRRQQRMIITKDSNRIERE